MRTGFENKKKKKNIGKGFLRDGDLNNKKRNFLRKLGIDLKEHSDLDELYRDRFGGNSLEETRLPGKWNSQQI